MYARVCGIGDVRGLMARRCPMQLAYMLVEMFEQTRSTFRLVCLIKQWRGFGLDLGMPCLLQC